MTKEKIEQAIRMASSHLHDLYLHLLSIAHLRADERETDEDPLFAACEKIADALPIVDGEVVHSNTFLLLKANGELSRVNMPVGDAGAFNSRVHELINCKYYEVVNIKPDYYFIVDELGKVTDPPKAINKKASLFYPGSNFGDPIVGDVIIAKEGYVCGDPDAVGLDEEDLCHFEGILNSIK